MSTKLAIFLDDGGVINDNKVRAPQWQRLVGEFMPPRLGGSSEEWAEANRAFTDRIFAPSAWEARLAAAADYVDFERIYYLDWLWGMCEVLGITPPPEEESIRMAREASIWIISRVRSAFPGASDAIRVLHERGYTLYTASGESSTDLAGYLDGMGVRHCFTRLYGPDLVNTLKVNPLFYRRILEDAGVAPSEALVLDDSRMVIGWISEVGARSLLVGEKVHPSVQGCLGAIGSLAQLPAFLQEKGLS